jgi:uncharacterized membrane protein HdeD (DUF308 family)
MAISSGLGAAVVASRVLPPLARHWWVFLVRGLVAIAFGLVALFYPAATLITFILFYAVFAIVDGVFAVVAAVRGKEGMGPRWWLALVGALSLFAGLAAYFLPDLTALALLTVIGVWALVYGIFEIIGAIRLRKEIDNEWMLLIHGVLAALFGIMVLVRPGAGALALIWLIASFALASGVVLVILSFRLKGLAGKA